MALTRIKTWSAGEVLTAADLNTEFNNILNNPITLISPFTTDLDLDGNKLILDSDADTSLSATTDDRVDFALGGTDIVRLNTVATAVNGVDLYGSATGDHPYIRPFGTDSNFGLDIRDSNGNEVLKTDGVASAVNELTITNAATGNNPSVSATGADTNIGIEITAKGSGGVTLSTTGNITLSAGGSALYGSDEITSFPSGTLMLFQQTTAPTGWTKQTTHNDKALRVVSGTAGSGGTTPLTTVFSRTATDGHSLTSAENGPHTHTVSWTTSSAPVSGRLLANDSGAASNRTITTSSSGSGTAHTHPLTNFDLQYVDIIIASRD